MKNDEIRMTNDQTNDEIQMTNDQSISNDQMLKRSEHSSPAHCQENNPGGARRLGACLRLSSSPMVLGLPGAGG
ncbi:MAG: hypothetical protein HY673_27395 [Chloroflexi bacterium]|nr:hypothetical protein [Chloroflexota bacterium]